MAKKKVTITLKEDVHLDLKRIALDNKKSVSELYEEILESYLERDKEQVTLEEYKTEGVNKEVESEKKKSNKEECFCLLLLLTFIICIF